MRHIPFPAELLEAKLIECLSPQSSTHVQPVLKTHHSDLVKELVRFAFPGEHRAHSFEHGL